MIKNRLHMLRQWMERQQIDAVIVPSTDPHHSEYVPPHWQRRAFISGFTGSAGDIVVSKDKAGLWTDSRYFIQAEQELENSSIQLYRLGVKGTPSITDWLHRNLLPNAVVGVDTQLFSQKQYNRYQANLKKHRITLQSLPSNPIDEIWTERPSLSNAPISAYSLEFAGIGIGEKLDSLRQEMKRMGTTVHIITTLDSIAWLFNIRGRDIPFNPVVVAYAVIELSCAHLFVDARKITPALKEHLSTHVTLHPYDEFTDYLEQIDINQCILLDPDEVSQWTFTKLPSNAKLIKQPTPIQLMKAKKNSTELSGMAAAHQRDGVAMVEFLCWLDQTLAQKQITEVEASTKLTDFRKQQDHFVGLSFSTISAFGPNGAIVHYEPSIDKCATLEPNNLYLLDSGAQYLDGTTDITRTLTLGDPTIEQKRCFTLVLKGHLNLVATSFPVGTSGNQLDTIARKPLWDEGLNFAHGTGHGVGAHLSVHEGPQAISYYRGMGVPLEAGMVVSIEPGYYKEGHFGIRIENLVKIVNDQKNSSSDVQFLTFETLTLCPIDQRLIDVGLLTRSEIVQLNQYHNRVYDTLAPNVCKDTKRWLTTATLPLEVS